MPCFSRNVDINMSKDSFRDLLDVGVGVPLGEDVRVFLPEDVTHSAAGQDLQRAAALPHPERDLCKTPSMQLSLIVCVLLLMLMLYSL